MCFSSERYFVIIKTLISQENVILINIYLCSESQNNRRTEREDIISYFENHKKITSEAINKELIQQKTM